MVASAKVVDFISRFVMTKELLSGRNKARMTPSALLIKMPMYEVYSAMYSIM